MSESRLEQHYRRLLSFYPEQQVTVTLGEIADRLCCTKRHMRGLLMRMQQQGWLSWQASAGRGHHSTLILHYSAQQLLLLKAEQLLDQGELSKAVSLLGHQQGLVASLLRQRLGYRVSEDYQSLRIPYYRTMPNLYPGTPLRRSEMHLVRQIFNGLTKVSPHSGVAEADLAHHWSQQDDQQWRFHLRPGVRFHDGRELSSEDVVDSLRRAAKQPLFAHLQQITASGRLTVDIRLSQPDRQLPLLLTDTAALILPADHASRPDFASHPSGTGPYLVAENNSLHLKMQSFDNYFGLRGLLDEIDVIVWPPAKQDEKPATLAASASPPSAWLSSSLSDIDYTTSVPDLAARQEGEMFPEKGGYFLLCDRRSACWQTAEERRWLREILSPWAILQRLIAPVRPLWIPAGSLLPDWLHGISPGECRYPTSLSQPGAVLRLAIHRQHPEFAMLVTEIAALLREQHIDLHCIELDYEHWASGEAEADLWLGTVNFPLPETWNVGAWLLGTPLLRASVCGGDPQQLERWHTDWREENITGKTLAAEVIAQGWLQPLFHHWMRLKSPGQAQGMHLNNLGWFDFTRAWMAPESDSPGNH